MLLPTCYNGIWKERDFNWEICHSNCTICQKVKRGEPLTVVSPGSQKRNFTHVDDIISGLILLESMGMEMSLELGVKRLIAY